MKKLLLITLLLVSSQLQAVEFFQPLSDSDYTRQSIFTLLTLIDWSQTKSFRSEEIRESNAILGSEPDQKTVDQMIFAGIVSHALVTWFLPVEYRETWQLFFIGVEASSVYHNYRSASLHASINLKF